MAKVVGSIRPEAKLSEAPAWTEPCRIYIITDAHGRRHGRIEWLASEVGENFDNAVLRLYTASQQDADPKPKPSVAL